MKKLITAASLIAGVAQIPTAFASQFLWSAGSFFSTCDHLLRAHPDEPSGDLMTDQSCARYIEGFELGYADKENWKPGCLPNPIQVFEEAQSFYDKKPAPNALPGKYLGASVAFSCQR